MVSKASEDLPEPDRPVNTTSLSRGISTSTFLRLCSRAPRIVIARRCDPAFCCWRFALITSSIPVVLKESQRRAIAPTFRRAWPGTGIGADGYVSERRKNGDGFPVRVANRQRIVGALAASGSSRAWQQRRLEQTKAGVTPRENKKAGARPAFRNAMALDAKLS